MVELHSPAEDEEWARMNPTEPEVVATCQEAHQLCMILQKMLTLTQWEYDQLSDCRKVFSYLIVKHHGTTEE